ncbi:MAG: 2-amino-4-hydroxy-6-hydroxymethyldihydropteridine diphosphokinase [Candidatus Symbiothrix sp.]|jgi:2-amino-4-hydroxy-6-hydroxymethyldihydropteridine diphosphokinase|nr:2-amino-4-hydroxy-6-hydroxymethyldihydropteridine diphosphokinase [Candidatus Symbiothrix sp.]
MTAYLSLGTNLGDKHLNLSLALDLITEKLGALSAVSSIYETLPCGFESPNNFLNMAVKIETPLTPLELLDATQAIERQLGRQTKTTDHYQDRIIDIDIILYEDWIFVSDRLIVPHPKYRERDFVMQPLSELM